MPAVMTIEDRNIDRIREGVRRSQSALPFVTELDKILEGRLSSRFARLAKEVDRHLADPRTRARGLELGEELIGEAMSYLAGAAAWKANLAGPVPLLALRWLDQLSKDADLPPVGLVMPAATEYVGALAQVIRLRVPDDGVWGLPVAVHEYGHFVVMEYGKRSTDTEGIATRTAPVEDFLRAFGKEQPNRYRRGHELFADAVAAMVAGPAYAYYCIRYRFDPAGRETDTHPAPVLRMRTILDVLHRLAPADPSGYLKAAAARAASLWAAQCQACGVGPEPAQDDQVDLASELVELALGSSHLQLIQYADHAAAAQLADVLADAGDLPAAPVPALVNAGWERRLRLEAGPADAAAHDQAVRALGQRVLDALTACHG